MRKSKNTEAVVSDSTFDGWQLDVEREWRLFHSMREKSAEFLNAA